jgi:exopolyphosphatase / guanosine-5'-triphosphate,3'-diphosphate pyrophosphatase
MSSFAAPESAGSPAPRSTALAVLRGGEEARAPEEPREAAVIDLGSNSWRLVVYRYVPGAWWRRTGQLQEPVRIAEGLAASGRLSPAAVARGLDTLGLFARYCRARRVGPEQLEAVATSAVRDAGNRDDLLSPARAATGFDIRVLTAEQEAHSAYLAAVNSTTLTDGTVLDLGGGSLQLVAVSRRHARAHGSWPLGAVRVTERLLPGSGPVSRKELKRARAAVRQELAGTEWLNRTGPRLVAVGGAVRNLATAVQRARGRDRAGIQGHVIGAQELRRLVTELASLPASGRALPGIKPSRADIILAAAVVLDAVVDLGEFDGIEVTRAGLREGVFFERRLFAGQPPLVPAVRAASVRDLAVLHGVCLRHAEHVACLAVQLHDSLAGEGVIAPAADERELLRAAATLHDLGMTIGYDGHQGHSHYLILSAGLPGFGPRELALIAQIVRYHRKGTPDLDDLRPFAGPGDRELVQRCALLVRLAELLESGQDQSVREARLEPEGRDLRLRLQGDDRLARWCAQRQMGEEAFRRVFGRRLVAAA